MWGSPIDERVELLSDSWVAAARELLERRAAEYANDLAGQNFTLSLSYRCAPPHLAFPNDVATMTVRFRGSEVAVERGFAPDADYAETGEYQIALPLAQAVGPISLQRTLKQIRHLFGNRTPSVTGRPPQGRLREICDEVHDHMARRTVENPDLPHRVRAQRLSRQVMEIAENGYTVLENAITEDFTEELRALAIDEMLSHNREVSPSGRINAMGLLNRGRPFEEIAQHPTLRTAMETALGAGMVFQGVSAAMKGPGPSAVAPHLDYSYVPEPYPEFALVGVAVWALDDWTVEAGPTVILPGSHRMRRWPRPTDSLEGGVPVVMPKGSVVFFTHGVWHWQGDRTAPGNRVTLHNAYQRPFMRMTDDFSDVEAVLHRNSPVLSVLTGKDDVFEKSNYCGHDLVRGLYMDRLVKYGQEANAFDGYAKAVSNTIKQPDLVPART
jgi:ectoine hydroxylase-related dioxygenase (phytanoyl-CoA dioxygenase family)